MKYAIIFLVILFLSNSCELFDVDYDTYTIDNQSDYNIIIKAYHHLEQSEISLIDSIFLLPDQQYDTIKLTGEDSGTNGYFSSIPDSVCIQFGNERIKIYTCLTPFDKLTNSTSCQDRGNIIQFMDTPNTFDNKRKGYDYTYILTNEDYSNAKPLE